jgi:hypothetical protein
MPRHAEGQRRDVSSAGGATAERGQELDGVDGEAVGRRVRVGADAPGLDDRHAECEKDGCHMQRDAGAAPYLIDEIQDQRTEHDHLEGTETWSWDRDNNPANGVTCDDGTSPTTAERL